MTQRGVTYVTKMKSNLTYETLSSTYYMNANGQMQWREEYVMFRKEAKAKETDENGEEKEVRRTIEHKARIVTYVDEKKHRITRLLTNNLEMPYEDIVAIYKKRWAIESLFKQLKQNFPPALLLRRKRQCHQDTDMGDPNRQPAADAAPEGVTHAWSFSGLATIVRITLMYYIDIMGFLEHPEKDWELALEKATSSPPATE